MDYDIKIFAERLKEIRKSHKETQVELAGFLNVDKSLIAKWETAKANASPELFLKLAEHYNVSTDFLYGKVNRPDRITIKDENGIDQGWVAVIEQAKASGVTPEQMKSLIKALESAIQKP